MTLKKLIIGKPGVGKTTLVARVVSCLEGRVSIGGFYTEEIRRGGRREGFMLKTLAGREGILAHIEKESRYRVGRYGVDISNLEHIGVESLMSALNECGLVVIDEIGKMELFSEAFRKSVADVFSSNKSVLATGMLAKHAFLEKIKRWSDVETVLITESNRDAIGDLLIKEFKM